jgi:hypothetical protein
MVKGSEAGIPLGRCGDDRGPERGDRCDREVERPGWIGSAQFPRSPLFLSFYVAVLQVLLQQRKLLVQRVSPARRYDISLTIWKF